VACTPRTKAVPDPVSDVTTPFVTERWLVQGRVQGELHYPDLTLRPYLSGSYTRDDQRAYIDSLGNRIAAQSVAMGQLDLGLDFSRKIKLSGEDWVLDGGISALFSETRIDGASRQSASDGARGRIDLGLQRPLANGGHVSFSGFYDGLGTPDYEAMGVEIGLLVKF
jgi:hypothetical protein